MLAFQKFAWTTHIRFFLCRHEMSNSILLQAAGLTSSHCCQILNSTIFQKHHLCKAPYRIVTDLQNICPEMHSTNCWIRTDQGLRSGKKLLVNAGSLRVCRAAGVKRSQKIKQRFGQISAGLFSVALLMFWSNRISCVAGRAKFLNTE